MVAEVIEWNVEKRQKSSRTLYEKFPSVRCKIEGLQKQRGERLSSVFMFLAIIESKFSAFCRRLIIGSLGMQRF